MAISPSLEIISHWLIDIVAPKARQVVGRGYRRRNMGCYDLNPLFVLYSPNWMEEQYIPPLLV
jgi:hypothetical protein